MESHKTLVQDLVLTKNVQYVKLLAQIANAVFDAKGALPFRVGLLPAAKCLQKTWIVSVTREPGLAWEVAQSSVDAMP